MLGALLLGQTCVGVVNAKPTLMLSGALAVGALVGGLVRVPLGRLVTEFTRCLNSIASAVTSSG